MSDKGGGTGGVVCSDNAMIWHQTTISMKAIIPVLATVEQSKTVNKIKPVKEKKHHIQGRYRRSVLSACVHVFSKIGVG